MRYVQEHGKPDLFLTYSCNPAWQEIVDNLLPNQKSVDRPDLVARVFEQKLQYFKAAVKSGYLGRVVAEIESIEF